MVSKFLNSLSYFAKIWLTTIFITPFFLVLMFEPVSLKEILGFFLLILIFSVVLSAPAMLVFYLLNEYIQKRMTSEAYRKMILMLYSVASIHLTFYLYQEKVVHNHEFFINPLSLSYCAVICASIWWYRKTKNTINNN